LDFFGLFGLLVQLFYFFFSLFELSEKFGLKIIYWNLQNNWRYCIVFLYWRSRLIDNFVKYFIIG
jgi:hypothetical protein